MKAIALGIAGVLCLLLAACAQPDALSIREAIAFGQCSAPCWHGLQPGRSTVEDVQVLLRVKEPLTIMVSQSRVDSTCEHWELGIENNEHIFDRRLVAIENGRVSLIQSGPDANFPLHAVISRFGNPEYIRAVAFQGPHGELDTLEVQYPSKGLAFVLEPDPSRPGMIWPWTPVNSVAYFAPGDLTSYVRTAIPCLNGRDPTDAVMADALGLYQPWQGYGRVQFIKSW